MPGPTGGTQSGSMPHVPVLLDEVLEALHPVQGKRVVDGTFGAGGYSRALLAAGAELIGIDRDPSVLAFAEGLSAEYPDHFTFISGTFSELDTLAADAGPIDAVVLDIGVSSMQLDEAGRGFSFMRDGPLDMRMSQSGVSAADLVNTLDETDLANLLFGLGEERKSRRIAKAVVASRSERSIETTAQLAAIIESAIGRRPGDMHPATRSFQALRIAVNREFDQLVQALFAAERLLGEGGVLVVVTFHSLEDRIVKRFFAQNEPGAKGSRHLPRGEESRARWSPVAKARKPGRVEIERNPRSRSAVIRSAVRTGAAARPFSTKGLGVPGTNWRDVA